jgi:hypothetical protein
MSAPHEQDTSKWGALIGGALSAAVGAYHYFKAKRSPKTGFRELIEHVDALEERIAHNERIHERDHREVMRLIRRLCDGLEIE